MENKSKSKDEKRLVSFITPTYNNPKYTDLFVKSVKDQGEVIVINDGGEPYKNDTCKVIDQENKGMSAAFNTGYRSATRNYLCFTDNDQVFCRNWVEPLIELLEIEGAGIICSEIVNGSFTADTPLEEILKCLDGNKGESIRVSANLPILIKREVFEKVGLWDEQYRGPGIFMDWDYYNRVAMADLSFMVTDRSTTYHFEAVTRKQLKEEFYWPNRYYFEGKMKEITDDRQELFGRKLGGFAGECF